MSVHVTFIYIALYTRQIVSKQLSIIHAIKNQHLSHTHCKVFAKGRSNCFVDSNVLCFLNDDACSGTHCASSGVWTLNLTTAFSKLPNQTLQQFHPKYHCTVWSNDWIPTYLCYKNSASPIKTHPEFQLCSLSYRQHLNKDFVLHFKGFIWILNHLHVLKVSVILIFNIMFITWNYCLHNSPAMKRFYKESLTIVLVDH